MILLSSLHAHPLATSASKYGNLQLDTLYVLRKRFEIPLPLGRHLHQGQQLQNVNEFQNTEGGFPIKIDTKISKYISSRICALIQRRTYFYNEKFGIFSQKSPHLLSFLEPFLVQPQIFPLNLIISDVLLEEPFILLGRDVISPPANSLQDSINGSITLLFLPDSFCLTTFL